MQIKTCTQNDIKDLISVSIQSYLEHYTYLWFDNGTNYVKTNFNFDKISEEMSDPNSIFLLIFDEQEPVGVIKLNINSETDNFSADIALELERIYFIKQASGKGFGKKAIEIIKDFAIQKGKKIIWLKAMESSSVVEFYKKQGFEIVGETYLNYSEIKTEFRKMFLMLMKL